MFVVRTRTLGALRRSNVPIGRRLERQCLRRLQTSASLAESFKSKHWIDIPDVDFFSYMNKHTAKYADKKAVICGMSGQTLTYKQLFDQAEQLGKSLQQRGYRKGDMAAILAPNIPEYIVTILGCAYAGLAITLINPLMQAHEVEDQLRTTHTVVFFVFATFAKVAFAAKTAVPKVREIYVYGAPLKYSKMNQVIDMYVKLFHGEASAWMFDELLSPAAQGKRKDFMRSPWLAEQIEYRPTEDIIIVPYSSGTAGNPKGTCHTHATIVAYLEQFKNYPPVAAHAGNGFLLVLPMFHIFGSMVPFLALKLGGFLVTNPLFKKTMFLSSIQKYDLKVLPVVPALINFMATDPEAYSKRKYDISCVQTIFSGGAPLSKELGAKFQEKFPNVKVMQGYGMTEGMIACTEDLDTPYESVGRLSPNNELIVRDTDSGRKCERNEPGELVVKTPSAFHCYLNNPEATEESFEVDANNERWLRTGDIGYIDDIGNLYITERLKALLKYKGHQVSPQEIEEELMKLTGVQDVAVAGIPHESYGEVPMAFVVVRPGFVLTADEVKNYVAQDMAFQNHLRGGVIFLDEIPRSRIGKILRGELKKLVKEKLASGELENMK